MELRMGNSGFTIELKSAALFGLTALVLSFVTGMASGNSLGYALFKSSIITLVFGAIGYGAVVVLKEVRARAHRNSRPRGGAGGQHDAVVSAPGEGPDEGQPGAGDQGDKEKKPDTGLEKEFEPLKSGDLKSYTSGPAPLDGKMGKHFVSEQKTVKYEPKIIAEAIRTMIRRDDKDLDLDRSRWSISAGKPTSDWPPLRSSISSGSSPKVQAV